MKIKKHVALCLLSVISFFLPNSTSAQLLLTEIMYDPSGTDTGREWVEIYNDGNTPVDLTQFRLFENSVAHSMKAFNAPSALLLADTYAIVADNPEKFLLDYPSYADLLIDSAFSLNNTGESVAIQSSDGVVESNVTYSTEWGAVGTGNSLQLSAGIWIPAAPTTAMKNATVPADESVDSNTSGATNTGTSTSSSSGSSSGANSTSSHNSQVSVSAYKPKINFEVSVGRDRYGFVNTPLKFVANHNQDKTSGMKFLWTSGDGDYAKGKVFEHTYTYEGEYNLVLNASYQNHQSVSRNKIYIRTPVVSVSMITRGKLVDIMFENRGEFEVNVGGYQVEISALGYSDTFEIPQDTIISAKKSIIIPSEITNFESEVLPNSIKVLYPNGRVMFDSIISSLNNIIP